MRRGHDSGGSPRKGTPNRGSAPDSPARGGERGNGKETGVGGVGSGGQLDQLFGLFSSPEKVEDEKQAFHQARLDPNKGMSPDIYPQDGATAQTFAAAVDGDEIDAGLNKVRLFLY